MTVVFTLLDLFALPIVIKSIIGISGTIKAMDGNLPSTSSLPKEVSLLIVTKYFAPRNNCAVSAGERHVRSSPALASGPERTSEVLFP